MTRPRDASRSGEGAIERPIRALTLTTLFPNSVQPFHGLFVERRLKRLTDTGAWRCEVVAPVPWFPFGSELFGKYSVFARVPLRERRGCFTVTHPRFPVIPKIGMEIAPWLMNLGVERHVRALFRSNRSDLLDAHYFYPDGVAAAELARKLCCPVVITARGSDINLIAEHAGPRRQIVKAALACDAIIAVSEALKARLTAIGVPEAKVTVLRNGVDLSDFRPLADREEVRRSLGLDGLVLLTVGNLVKGKRQDVAIRALTRLPGATLLLAGDGPLRGELERLATQMGVADRVRFLRQLGVEPLVRYYNGADATLLTSSREGMPNVVLESLACGTPVVASRVGGIPEILVDPNAGVIVDPVSPATVADAATALHANMTSRDSARRLARQFGWDETVKAQIELYRRVLEHRGRRLAPTC